MDNELKTKWIEALRSGKYKQISGALYDGNGYCCLGVLCDLNGTELVADSSDQLNKEIYPKIREILDSPGSCVSDELINMNDEQGATFSQIADYIEAGFPKREQVEEEVEA